mmetsp:Transcript_19012/g.44157  ORF Transcript_19012/g.44157 Transcript_19012/m.44157 type:complete len:242 (-) Transcript_19012:108-833(-)
MLSPRLPPRPSPRLFVIELIQCMPVILTLLPHQCLVFHLGRLEHLPHLLLRRRTHHLALLPLLPLVLLHVKPPLLVDGRALLRLPRLGRVRVVPEAPFERGQGVDLLPVLHLLPPNLGQVVDPLLVPHRLELVLSERASRNHPSRGLDLDLALALECTVHPLLLLLLVLSHLLPPQACLVDHVIQRTWHRARSEVRGWKVGRLGLDRGQVASRHNARGGPRSGAGLCSGQCGRRQRLHTRL